MGKLLGMLTDVSSSGDAAVYHMGRAFAAAYGSLDVPHIKPTATGVRILTGKPHPFGNFALGLADGEIEGAAAVLSEANAPAMIFIEGADRGDPRRILTGHGFEHHGAMPAMAVDIDRMSTANLADGYRFDQLDTENADLVAGWERVMGIGFETPPDLVRIFGPQSVGETAPTTFFDVTHRGETVGCSLLVLTEGVAGIYCVATLPEHRGKGIGAALTAGPLRIAREQGYRIGVLQASKMGYSVYRKLGFEDVGELQMYFRTPL